MKMKQLPIFTLLLAFVCSYGIFPTIPQAAAQEALSHQRYVIDSKVVERFDGSQLEGKKIVSYRISTVNSPEKGTIWVHDIRTEGASKASDPAYIVDGKQVPKKTFENLSPARIKSITVIKYASPEEFQQYSGWENGVIMVETKPDEFTTKTGSAATIVNSNPGASVKSGDKNK